MMNLLTDIDLKSFWKKLNIKDAIYAISRAWDGVKSTHIARAFSKIMTMDENEAEEFTLVPELSSNAIHTIAQQVDELNAIEEAEIEGWLRCDQNDLGYEKMTEEEIIGKHVIQDETIDIRVDDIEEENSGAEEVKITHSQAINAVDTVLCYFEQQPEVDVSIVLNLRKIKETIKSNLFEKKVQTKLTDFFTNKENM